MRKILTTVLLALSAMRGFKSPRFLSLDLARLKMSLVYVKSIKTFRLLFVSLLGVGAALVFLAAGLFVLQATLFSYTPWSSETKLYVGLGCTVLYLLLAGGICVFIFSESLWLKIFNAETLLDALNREFPDEQELSGSNGKNKTRDRVHA